ncbi:putative membrane protein [Limimonas halophila]|uniref:Putative membrane protein n=1 Tax=Limimonas halophila TaxID=1082479 RepID=A0A1G7R8F8_9PROT|nr:SHOCT domain-containing protein [Limimonas halophila]SDG06935.1 putative membrane protein [Limimonas halophila]
MRFARTMAAVAALGASAPALAVAQEGGRYYGPQHMMGPGGWGWIMGPLMMIVFLAVAVTVVVLIVRWLGGHTNHPHQPPASGRTGESPLEILEKRFARGEIDREEFEERRKMLER